ncbi:hypothetical protein LCGC14_1127730 [marine sediment metagenome]|uniref:Uncharacterized protein n=1 Tax=marine sediment metagenome TaxID=412755 RepID=A0A0F9MPU9_9ZZZZ
MSWVNWADVDRFGELGGLSTKDAHEWNKESPIPEKRREYAAEFERYEQPLKTILWSSNSSKVARALFDVPNDVLFAFFGILGPTVVDKKGDLGGGSDLGWRE